VGAPEDAGVNNDPMPPVTSLGEWEVGKNALGENEVRFILKDNAEAQAWAMWFLNNLTDDEGLSVTIGG
jgi:hypothetical protein